MAVENRQRELVADFVSEFLESIGEDPSRDGLKETPDRVRRLYEELLAGYSQDPSTVFRKFGNNGYKDLVVVENIRFFSLCEHHMIPFFGRVNIGYVPNGHILGLSKFARVVEIFSRRLQTQENLTKQVADCIQDNLSPVGLIVSVEAEHLCMSMRGIKKNDCITKTTTASGSLKDNQALLNQFYLATTGRGYEGN